MRRFARADSAPLRAWPRSLSLDPRILDELNRRLAEAAARLRALAADGGLADPGRIEQAGRRIDSAAELAGLLADRERPRALRDAEEALTDRLGHDPPATLLDRAVGLAGLFQPALSCGLWCAGAVVASDGWERSFRAWHEGPGRGPRRCPLLAVGARTAVVRVDRIAAAASWPEWRAASLAHGRRSAIGLAVAGDRTTLLIYSRTPGFAEAEIEAAHRIVQLAARILEHAPPADPFI